MAGLVSQVSTWTTRGICATKLSGGVLLEEWIEGSLFVYHAGITRVSLL